MDSPKLSQNLKYMTIKFLLMYLQSVNKLKGEKKIPEQPAHKKKILLYIWACCSFKFSLWVKFASFWLQRNYISITVQVETL